MARTLRYSILGVLCLLLIARAPYVVGIMDSSRDLFIALRLLHGESFPLAGPILGGVFHLGPSWYYVLAALLALCGGNALVLAIVLSALWAMQVPFAYLAGKALYDRGTGIAWAALLTLPSWTVYDSLAMSHPSFAWPALLAFLICCLRWWRGAKTRYLYGMALAFVIALHAHPSTIALTWIGLPLIALRAARGGLRLSDAAIAAAIVLLPLLPVFGWDAARDFSDLNAAGGYLATFDPVRAVADLWPLLRAIAFAGTLHWFSTMFAMHGWATCIAATLLAFLVLAGIGIARLAAHAHTRTRALLALGVLAASLLATNVLRDLTPFYMTAPAQIAFTGTFALGLAAAFDARRARAAVGAGIVLFAALACAVVDVQSARLLARGAWPVAWLPAADVKRDAQPPVPQLFMPAYALAASGSFLCSEPMLALHGSYASHLLQNYAIEMRLACNRGDVELGGHDPARRHWLGLTRSMFARLEREPERHLGPVRLVPAQPLDFGQALRLPDEPRYPVYRPTLGAEQTRTLRVDLEAGQFLAVSDLAASLDAGYTVTARLDGRALAARAEDTIARVYACEGCAPGTRAALELTLRSRNLDDLDIVVF